MKNESMILKPVGTPDPQAADACSLVQERPGVRAVEPANSHGGDQLRVEASEVDALFRAGLLLDRLPVGHAAAMPAADRAQCLVALDIGLGRFGMAVDRHCSEFEVHPRA